MAQNGICQLYIPRPAATGPDDEAHARLCLEPAFMGKSERRTRRLTHYDAWPDLDWPAWRETAIGLQLRTQIVGKLRLALTPWLNHSWHVPLYLSARGLTTSAIPLGDRILQADFDFL